MDATTNTGERVLDGLGSFTEQDRRRLATIREKLYASAFAISRGPYRSQRGATRVLAACAVRDAYAFLIAIGGTDEDIERACRGDLNRQQANPHGLVGPCVTARGNLTRTITLGSDKPSDDLFEHDITYLVSILPTGWTDGSTIGPIRHLYQPPSRERADRAWWRFW